MSDDHEIRDEQAEQQPTSKGPIYLGLMFLAFFIMVTLGVIYAFFVDPQPGGERQPFQWQHIEERVKGSEDSQ